MCVSNGQLPNEGVNITISAVNCDDQEGSNTTITVLPRGRDVLLNLHFCLALKGIHD